MIQKEYCGEEFIVEGIKSEHKTNFIHQDKEIRKDL